MRLKECELWREDLDGEAAAVAAMHGAVDDGHSTAAQLASDVVVGREQVLYVSKKLVSHANWTIWLRHAQARANFESGARFRGCGFARRKRQSKDFG